MTAESGLLVVVSSGGERFVGFVGSLAELANPVVTLKRARQYNSHVSMVMSQQGPGYQVASGTLPVDVVIPGPTDISIIPNYWYLVPEEHKATILQLMAKADEFETMLRAKNSGIEIPRGNVLPKPPRN